MTDINGTKMKGTKMKVPVNEFTGSSVYTVALTVYIVTFTDAEYQAKLGNSFWLNTGLHVGMIQSHF